MSPRRERPIERFGPYDLLERIGRGGMGEVWRARDVAHDDRHVALKRLLPDRLATVEDEAEFQRRFREEARATAALTSEHVITIHDYGEIDGRLFIDMKLVSGGDLAQEIGRNRRGLAVGTAAGLCEQIAHGLDDAHAHGLVHRDIKPSNLLLSTDARGRKVYLVDFGIAKVADEAAENETRTGTTLGTYGYMAPELIRNAKDASVRSDVYALGCVLFEMLTGSRAFPMTGSALIVAQLEKEPPRPSAVRPELAPFDLVVARALAKRPRDRHRSAGELAREVTVAAEAHRDAARASNGGARNHERACGGRGGPADTEAPPQDGGGRPGASARPTAEETGGNRTSRARAMAGWVFVAVVLSLGAVGIATDHSSGAAPIPTPTRSLPLPTTATPPPLPFSWKTSTTSGPTSIRPRIATGPLRTTLPRPLIRKPLPIR